MEGVLDADDYLILINSLKVDNGKLKKENIRLRKMVASMKANYTSSISNGLQQRYQSTNQAQAVVRKSKAYLQSKKPSITTRKETSKTIEEQLSGSSTSRARIPEEASSSNSKRARHPSAKKIESLEMGDKLLLGMERRAETRKRQYPSGGMLNAEVKKKKSKKKLPYCRNDNDKGFVSNYPNGYHIVWKGSPSGSDMLHDKNGYSYYCYVDPRINSAAYRNPSDHGAYWRCNVKRSNGNPCGFMLLEKDGDFKEISLKHQHDNSRGRKTVTCVSCLSNQQ